MIIAHTKNQQGNRQLLSAHLKQVAQMAGGFAQPFDATQFAWVAGIMHDIGKYNPVFQEYLLNAEQGIKAKRGPDHKGAGAVRP